MRPPLLCSGFRHKLAQKVVAAGRAARLELRRHCELAIASAKQKIAARMSPQTQDRFLQTFVADLSKLRTAEAYAPILLSKHPIYVMLDDPGATSRVYAVPSGGASSKS